MAQKNNEPRILVFTTNLISDPAVDMTGLLHKHYPATTSIIRMPCSSMVRPDYVLLAFQSGFDGVFIAADGSECPYLEDCGEKTAKNVEKAIELMKENGIDPRRLKMAAICSVCVEPFLKHIKDFSKKLKELKEEN